MNSKVKTWGIVVLLVLCIFLSFAFPKAKYEGTGYINTLHIPAELPGWKGKDVSDQLNILPDSNVFNFISDVLAYEYVNRKGERLLFIILDAGNFHHPKGCFTYAGYEIEELNDTEFNTSGYSLKVHTLFTKKAYDKFLTFYWIVIDKNVAHKWIEQKFKQLYFSLFNKKRVGLMVRIDIPTTKENIDNSYVLAKEFVKDMSKVLNQEDSDYIFGQL